MIFPKGGAELEDTVLFGKYQICRMLGRGRSGTVFLARHIGLDELRAIKRVSKEGNELFREASVIKNLKNPGIPIIYDLEEDSDYYYLIEEYLEGESLSALVERKGSLTKAKVISFGMELCQIIYYLHSIKPNPILYLDLQPKNLLICYGALKLIDFDQAVSASLAGTLKKRYGTVGCAAPEQYTDETLDERTDIYAIGALLYYMGTGTFWNQTQTTFPNLTAAFGEELGAVIMRCLGRQKEERFGDVQELMNELLKLKAGVFAENQISLLKTAVAGSSHGMGATHVSLSVCSYLAREGLTALYSEKNDSGTVMNMVSRLGKSPDEYGVYHMEDWALKPQYGRCVKLTQPAYDAAVEDHGTGLQAVLEGDYDLVILVCGGKWWDLDSTVKAVRTLAQKKNLRVIFNHISPDMDIILPEDIVSLRFYGLPFFPSLKENEILFRFWDEVTEGTDAAGKIQKISQTGETAKKRIEKRKAAVKGCLERFLCILTERKRR